MKTLPFILISLLAFWSGTASAQVAGRVLDDAGRPVTAASVEIWTPSRRLATAATDQEGRFAFSAEASAGATSVAVHRLGFQGATVALRGAEAIEVRLRPAPLALAGVRVTARERRLCPVRDMPRARSMWEAARAGYSAVPSAHDVRLRSDRYEADVPRAEIGVVDGRAPAKGGFTTADLAFYGADADGMLLGVYARRVDYGAREHWEYAPLAWGLNPHFVSARFGAAHRFSIVSESGGVVVLAFCPMNAEAPSIEGTLTLTADGMLRTARWRYVVPRSRSEAGGEVDYLPRDAATGNLLLARRGLFWRSWRSAFHFREDRYSEWIVAERSVPAAR
ncbi:MAG TPA: carboxypeptidase-like regulatory domain-containing protein [Longimicrobium sp.]|jgi:hypothetical protein